MARAVRGTGIAIVTGPRRTGGRFFPRVASKGNIADRAGRGPGYRADGEAPAASNESPSPRKRAWPRPLASRRKIPLLIAPHPRVR